MSEFFQSNKAYSGVLITKVKADDGTTSIDMVTTDIHRLSVLKIKNFNVDIEEFENGIVIPGKNFAEITKIFAECKEAQIAIDNDKEDSLKTSFRNISR